MENLIKHSTDLINKHGFDHVTLQQVCLSSKTTKGEILAKFCTFEMLLKECLSASLNKFVSNMRLKLNGERVMVKSLPALWYEILVYNCEHFGNANVLDQYLRNPARFSIPDLKIKVTSVFHRTFDLIEINSYQKTSDAIRFIIFNCMHHEANAFARRVPSGYSDLMRCTDFYFQEVAPEIDKLMCLPIN